MKLTTCLSSARTLTLAVVFASLLAFVGTAHADGHSHKVKKGNLKIKTLTVVGGTILQPGDYEVRKVSSPDGTMVEFVQVVYVPASPETFWPYEEQVVARVKSTEQALSAPPKHTRLQLAPETMIASVLEIRGDEVEYVFAPSQPASGADATPVADGNVFKSAAQNNEPQHMGTNMGTHNKQKKEKVEWAPFDYN